VKCLFIDGNHLLHRNAHVHTDLTYGNEPTGAMYGFFNSIGKIKREYPAHHVVIAWDMGHKRRDEESLEAVKAGIVPEPYKGNRTKDEDATQENDLVRWQINQQWNALREGLKYTTCQQVQKKGFEADDIIASYVMSMDDPATIVTSDKDYYQLLEPGIIIRDDHHDKVVTLDSFREEFGLVAPQQWIDVGALTGDSSDNIFGVDGIGIKTACKLIIQHKSLKNLLKHLKEERDKGVELPKRHAAILQFEERVLLAFSLKQMDDAIEDLPPLVRRCGRNEELTQFFNKYAFESLIDYIPVLS